MHIVKSVGVLSVAKMMGLVYGALGLIFVPFFLLAAMISGAAAGPDKSPLATFGMGFGVAFLYNVIAKWVGGFEVNVELKPTTPYAPYPIVPPATPRP